NTRFWSDTWISDLPLCVRLPQLFALEEDKEVYVASKLGSSSVDSSFQRPVRDGIKRQQWSYLSSLLESVILSPSKDRWLCDLNEEGAFHVKDVRSIIDDIFLSSSEVATRICRWWDLDWQDVSSFPDWDGWFANVRLPYKLKLLLEGVFYAA
nr:RNA-directed DNA polymerase, eukaryota, reverse transcriptase zinc-binding domain protein [Tanacetum cinerariifolium]